MSKQLEKHSSQNVILTLAEIERNDQFGEWSFKEIGYRLHPDHPNYGTIAHNFCLIDLPESRNYRYYWSIAKKMVDKNKSSNEIQSVLNYLSYKGWYPSCFQATNVG